jgi:hypothetical protein
MATGNTVTDSLSDSLPTAIASARIVREQKGIMTQLVDKETLANNTGLTWNEISLAQLTAQSVTEQTELDNPQQLSDTLFSVTPTVIGIQTLITDRVGRRLSSKSIAKFGSLAQNAMQRKKDIDGLTAVDGATTALGTAGASLVSGLIRAGKARITSNTTEPNFTGQINCVLHGFQIKDIEDEIIVPTSGALVVGSLAGDLADKTFTDGFQGMVGGVKIHEDGNIEINATTDDAKGGIFARDALVLVQGHSPRSETRREHHIGGGASSVFMYDEYAYGERSAGNWLYEIISDATTPTT